VNTFHFLYIDSYYIFEKCVLTLERTDEQLKRISGEIQVMKANRVKLVRQMREENEKYRVWRQQKEREVARLKEQDRKRQGQLQRMETLHTKQQNVLRRKMEDAMAVSKRLKEALSLNSQKLSNKAAANSSENEKRIKGMLAWDRGSLQDWDGARVSENFVAFLSSVAKKKKSNPEWITARFLFSGCSLHFITFYGRSPHLGLLLIRFNDIDCVWFVTGWLLGELNLLTSTTEAEQTLNELVESRKVLSARQAKLQAKLDGAGENSAFAQALMSEIANVGGDLDVRTEQIVELKQKIAAADLETKAKTRLDYLQTMIEAKVCNSLSLIDIN